MSEAQERAIIQDSIDTIRKHTGQKLDGWLAPALTNTEHTHRPPRRDGPQLRLRPFPRRPARPVKVQQGRLISMPYSLEMNDAIAFSVSWITPRHYARHHQAPVRPAVRGGRGIRHGDVHPAASLSDRPAAPHQGVRGGARSTSPATTRCGSRPGARSRGTSSTTTTTPSPRRRCRSEAHDFLTTTSSIRIAATAWTTTATSGPCFLERKPVKWPNGARVALWVTVSLQWFPLDKQGKPFKALGGLQTAYPDLRHYTLRDYGNRVGIFRIMQALDEARHPRQRAGERRGRRALSLAACRKHRSAGLGDRRPRPRHGSPALRRDDRTRRGSIAQILEILRQVRQGARLAVSRQVGVAPDARSARRRPASTTCATGSTTTCLTR